LIELNEEGLSVALGSASRNSVRILTGLGIINLFDEIIDGNKTTKSKPHPQVFLMGAKALQLAPSECVVFEDSINGVKAANKGGFTSVGVGDVEILNEADYIVSDLSDMTIAKLNKMARR